MSHFYFTFITTIVTKNRICPQYYTIITHYMILGTEINISKQKNLCLLDRDMGGRLYKGELTAEKYDYRQNT